MLKDLGGTSAPRRSRGRPKAADNIFSVFCTPWKKEETLCDKITSGNCLLNFI